jgi:hypothetical protein
MHVACYEKLDQFPALDPPPLPKALVLRDNGSEFTNPEHGSVGVSQSPMWNRSTAHCGPSTWTCTGPTLAEAKPVIEIWRRKYYNESRPHRFAGGEDFNESAS